MKCCENLSFELVWDDNMYVHPCLHIACNDSRGVVCPVLVLEAWVQISGKTKGIRAHASVVALPRSLRTLPPKCFAFYSVKRTLIGAGDVRERVGGCIDRPLGCYCHLRQRRNCECIKPLSRNLVRKAGSNKAYERAAFSREPARPQMHRGL